MTNIRQLRRIVRKQLGLGKSTRVIAKEYLNNISHADVKRILEKYPGKKVAEQLGIPVVCHICHRRIPDPLKKKHTHPPLSEHVSWFRKLPKEKRDEMLAQLYRTYKEFSD